MKTNFEIEMSGWEEAGRCLSGSRHRRVFSLFQVLASSIAVVCILLTSGARAEISEPDNVLYGTIVIGTNPVTAVRSDVVIEARRTPGGPALSIYRMGTSPGLGNFYRLRISVEAFAPLTDTNASLAGNTIYVVLRDASGVQAQATYAITERGTVQRVNFGAAVGDSDGNGLPDAWEIARLGGIGQDPNADGDGDGQSHLKEWIAGTNPLDANDAFKITILQGAGRVEVAFVALRAEGSGYEGVTRFYSLESSPSAGSGPWSGLTNFLRVPGNNQVVSYGSPVAGTNSPRFYRGTVHLE